MVRLLLLLLLFAAPAAAADHTITLTTQQENILGYLLRAEQVANPGTTEAQMLAAIVTKALQAQGQNLRAKIGEAVMNKYNAASAAQRNNVNTILGVTAADLTP